MRHLRQAMANNLAQMHSVTTTDVDTDLSAGSGINIDSIINSDSDRFANVKNQLSSYEEDLQMPHLTGGTIANEQLEKSQKKQGDDQSYSKEKQKDDLDNFPSSLNKEGNI